QRPGVPRPISNPRGCSGYSTIGTLKTSSVILLRSSSFWRAMPYAKCWSCARVFPILHSVVQGRFVSGHPFRHAVSFRMSSPLGADLFTGWTRLHVSQARFVGLLIRFHFLFLVLPLSLLRKLGLNFIAVQKRSPCRVGAGFTIF